MSHVYQLMAGYHNGNGNFFANIFTYELSEAGAGDAFHWADALITAFKAGPEVDLANLLGTDVFIDFYQAKRISGTGGPSATQVSGTNGTGGGNSISSQLAAAIAWITAAPNNRFGHSYIGGVYEGSLEQDYWQPAFLLLVAAFVNSMKTQLVLAGGMGNADLGVYTRKTGQFNKATAGEIKPKATVMNKRARPRV